MADEKGHPSINLPVAFTMLASMSMTIKDVYRYSDRLDTDCDDQDISKQTLMMVDNRPAEIRTLYKDAIYGFFFYLDRVSTKESYMPAVHLATVLLKMYSDLEAYYFDNHKGNKAVNLTEDKKNIH